MATQRSEKSMHWAKIGGVLPVVLALMGGCNEPVDSDPSQTDGNRDAASGDGDTPGDGGGETGGDGDTPGDGGAMGDGDASSGGAAGDDDTSSGGVAGGGGTIASGGSSSVAGDLVPAFIVQGHLGRTVLSCDDGRTWIFDQADDVGDGTCWSGDNEIECDHNEGAGRGLAYGNGQFFAMFGWGTPSTLRRTEDGIDWGLRIESAADENYGGVAYFDGTLLAAGRVSKTSTDDGLTWSEPVDTGMIGWNVRRAGTAGNRFVIVGDADDVVLSADKGATWVAPDVMPAGCGAGIQTEGGIAFGEGVIVIVGNDGTACYSSDGGVTFGMANVGGNVESHLVWSGVDFVVYGGGNAYRSPDGEAWTATAISPSVNLGAIAVSDAGTFAGVEGGWGEDYWYAGQEFFRSEDGINWESLPEGSYTGGHPVRTMTFGYVRSSASCPAL